MAGQKQIQRQLMKYNKNKNRENHQHIFGMQRIIMSTNQTPTYLNMVPTSLVPQETLLFQAGIRHRNLRRQCHQFHVQSHHFRNQKSVLCRFSLMNIWLPWSTLIERKRLRFPVSFVALARCPLMFYRVDTVDEDSPGQPSV